MPAQMPTGRKAAREEELVAQALKLFSEDGYRETSLQDVADKLGITRPLFYYYFKSKDDLLWRIIGHLGDQLLEDARPIADSSASPRDKLRRVLEAHVEALLGNAEAFRVYFAERHQVRDERDRRLRRGEHAYQALLVEIIEQGQAEGTFKDDPAMVLVMLAQGMANSVLTWYGRGGALSAGQISRLVAEVACDAVSARAR
jgi:TetR/AcrR family transcriptional regulator, cholesterol catabolism regulator